MATVRQIMRPNRSYLFHFACFGCQRTFKRSLKGEEMTKTCPNCGGASVRLGRHFEAPKSSDNSQWEKVRLLVSRGFLFQHVYEGDRFGPLARYPTDLAEAHVFVVRYRDQAWTDLPQAVRDAIPSV